MVTRETFVIVGGGHAGAEAAGACPGKVSMGGSCCLTPGHRRSSGQGERRAPRTPDSTIRESSNWRAEECL